MNYDSSRSRREARIRVLYVPPPPRIHVHGTVSAGAQTTRHNGVVICVNRGNVRVAKKFCGMFLKHIIMARRLGSFLPFLSGIVSRRKHSNPSVARFLGTFGVKNLINRLATLRAGLYFFHLFAIRGDTIDDERLKGKGREEWNANRARIFIATIVGFEK